MSQKSDEFDLDAELAAKGSHWIKCTSTEGHIRGVAIQGTELLQELQKQHSLNETMMSGLGEAALAGLLLSSFCKQGEVVNLKIKSDGPFQQTIVDGRPDGRVRGYIVPSQGATELSSDQSTRGPWGQGLLTVLRTKPFEIQKPYVGTVELVTGHLAKDFAFYWTQSEQIPSAVGIAINFEDGLVSSAGAFMIQTLPGALERDVERIQEGILHFPTFAEDIGRGVDPIALLGRLYSDLGFLILEDKPVSLFCDCSKERVERALKLIDPKELEEMITQDKQASVNCDFCSKEYRFTEADLRKLASAPAP